jgi:hypothetical protein
MLFALQQGHGDKMKDHTKLAIIFTLATGLMSGAAIAETDNEMAGGRLLAHLAQDSVLATGDRVAALQTEFRRVNYVYDFNRAAELPTDSPIAAAMADIKPAAGEPVSQKPAVTMLARAQITRNGAEVRTGSSFSETVFYTRSLPETDPFVGWICAKDAMKAFDEFVRTMAKAEFFDLEKFAKANADTIIKAGEARLANLVLNQNQDLAVDVIAGKIKIEAYMEQLVTQLKKSDLDKPFVLPEEVHVQRTLAQAYKELDPQYKPKGGIVVNKLPEDCCKKAP